MDNTQLMQKAAASGFTSEEQAHLSIALDTQSKVDQVTAAAAALDFSDILTPRAQQYLGAFDWTTLLSAILPLILGLFTGGAGGALIPFINLILSIFKINPLPVPAPGPTPVPNPSPFVIPTPMP